ncbi:MAG: response regulator, partial [Proteobacteria bacterium]|nr:response regulator [Pseudomonadota bacterium]
MDKYQTTGSHQAARKKFLELSLESTRKSYYPQLQRQLENAKENEKRLQLLIDNLPAQISYVNSEERYVLVNQEFEKSFDRKRDQIIGQRMENILGHKNYNKVKPHIELALSGKSGNFEFSFTTKNKISKWYEIDYVSETDKKGKVNGFYILTIDLTEKKQAEEERLRLKDRLRQAQKMEAIGTLSGGIAHDFNNILSGIFGFSQLVNGHANEPDKVMEYNKKIFEGAQRASSLIQQILSFSRQTKYSKQPISLFHILNEVLGLMRSTFPSNIEIKAVLKSKAMVLADSTQMHQVMMNLCTNAYHAMGYDGGILSVVLDEIALSQEDLSGDLSGCLGKYVKIAVSDTGAGIEDQIKEKIFDPYFTTKKAGDGTGLGLAVVNGIVKKHNGFIDFFSTIGVGTTFQIYLPVITDNAIPLILPEKSKIEQLASSERIMLVDDEQAILETLGALLSAKGFQISTFDNGEAALNAFAKNPDQFDLIVTDMTMPKMTGDKLAKEILGIRPEMPIILCSGYSDRIDAEKAAALGIRKYI